MFVRNSWYCLGWAGDFGDEPKGIRILDEYLVAYRGESGKLFVVSGRCPHRFAPLDKGKIIGDAIQCPYHGLRYDGDGNCVLNPHHDGHIPPRARLSSFTIAERNSALWVWMGEPEKADESLLPPQNPIFTAEYASRTISLHFPVNYQLIVDNLLDLSHAIFLHAGTLSAGYDKIGKRTNKLKIDGDVIHSISTTENSPPAQLSKSLFCDPAGHLTATMSWYPVSSLMLDIWLRPNEGGKADALNIPSVHFLSPETETSTHYFAAIGRNLEIDNAEIDRNMINTITEAFVKEDEPMIAACQELMGTTDLLSLEPVILATDAAALQARKHTRRLLEKEGSSRIGENRKAIA